MMTSPRPRLRWLTMVLTLGLLVPLLGSAGTTGEAAAAAPAYVGVTVGGYRTYAHFNNPDNPDGYDTTITDEVQRLIDDTPAGETIRGHIYSLGLRNIAAALLNAQTRGVTVYISLDQQNDNKRKVADDIRKLDHHHFCTKGAGHACISDADGSIAHPKFFTFSKTLDPTGGLRSDVSWFGSANMTETSGTNQFNNAITVYGDGALFAGLVTFAEAMYDQPYRGTDFYDADSGRGRYVGAAATAYASPEKRGQTDIIVSRLNDMTPDASCRLRIGMAFVRESRPALVELVKEFRSKGCRVWMVIGAEKHRMTMDESVYQELIAAGVKIRRAGGKDVHDKFFLAYGKFGSTSQYRVYTGSENWSSRALNKNDELFVKMAPETKASHPLYRAFVHHFDDAYEGGKTGLGG
jgi:phosphatidylserine/phosphatidylglycerophosphate/cardiolipin synthase-like enzyme